MSRDLSFSVSSSLDKPVVTPFFAIELLFDAGQTLRLWTGNGTLVHEGNDWFGTGVMLSIDAIDETSEIAARGATITLSGVPSDVLSLALSEPYQGRVCNIYLGMFVVGDLLLEDGSYILFEGGEIVALEGSETDLTEIFSGFMDQMSIEETAVNCSVSLKVENKLIDLDRPRLARYTSAYQKSLYPADKGMDFIEDLQDKELFWGRTSA